ncbi:hypothetical protein [Pseudohongiella spirulinae]|uniref:Lipoprotein n=1 Tax=Pseudohongiella spirulinae TaxID=1249552 RepID=A0A0S2KGX8_9GAMM|nr:hypothetical protein [Pseudohongiella spirulinae]ALO47565.1 hypothetical protein PS2015_2938 [Pseudohongiella spirulinae]
MKIKNKCLTLARQRFWPGLWLVLLAALSACTSTTIDEFRQAETGLNTGETVVILGRRQGAGYETAADFVQCVGDRMARGRDGLNVVPEQQFVDALFPWFEPRTAPLRSDDLQQLMAQPMVSDKMNEFGVRYIVWLDGQTETSNRMGSISCTVGPGGGGCFGFGSWEDDSSFEARVWDVSSNLAVGTISADASGQSYMPAVFVPIPLIARVEANACNSLADQLKQFVQGG